MVAGFLVFDFFRGYFLIERNHSFHFGKLLFVHILLIAYHFLSITFVPRVIFLYFFPDESVPVFHFVLKVSSLPVPILSRREKKGPVFCLVDV